MLFSLCLDLLNTYKAAAQEVEWVNQAGVIQDLLINDSLIIKSFLIRSSVIPQ